MTDTAVPATSDATGGGATPHFGELVAQLRAAYDRGHTRPLPWRRAQLHALLRLVEENDAELGEALAADLGRPALEAYTADLGTTKLEVKHLLKHLDRYARPRKVRVPVTSQPGRGEVVAEPLGVVLVIAPWNYPIQLLLSPLAAAIAAGNAVVAKPSELAPACSAVLARLIPRYLDPAAVAVAEGGVPETTALLAERWDHIFFTGSTAVGRVVMAAAAPHLTPVTLELGGKSPAIVAADADLGATARRLAWGKLLNAGQTCVAPDYVLVERAVADRLVDGIAAAVTEFLGPDPQRSPDFGRIVNERHLARLAGLLEDHGGTVAVGGDTDPADRYVAPTVVVDPDPTSALMSEEIFGPVLPVLAVDSVDEAVRFVNARPKPLALYVFSEDDATVDGVVHRTSSGGVCVNHCIVHLLPSDLPFGGVGDSGMGAYHGRASFDTFSHLKPVLRKPTRPDPPLMYPPYKGWKEQVIRRAL